MTDTATKTETEAATPTAIGPWVLLLLAIAVGVYLKWDDIYAFLFPVDSLTGKKKGGQDYKAPSSGALPGRSSMTNDTVLKQGDRGPQVERFQILLNRQLKRRGLSIMPLEVDGVFGPKTQAALAALQLPNLSVNHLETIINKSS